MKKILLAMLIAIFTLSTMALPATSQTEIGVAVDDWFEYTISATQTSNATTAYVPNIIGNMALGTVTYNLILSTPYASVKRTVTDVAGTVVTFTEEWTPEGGTPTVLEGVVANATYCNMYWALIPANLEADDAVSADPALSYPQSGGFYINSTGTKTYESDETRDTCTMTWYYDHNNSMAFFDASYTWDQTTGILVESNLTTYFWQSGAVTTTIFLFELGASSKWDVPEFPTGTVMLLVFVSIAASIEVYRRKKLKL